MTKQIVSEILEDMVDDEKEELQAIIDEFGVCYNRQHRLFDSLQEMHIEEMMADYQETIARMRELFGQIGEIAISVHPEAEVVFNRYSNPSVHWMSLTIMDRETIAI